MATPRSKDAGSMSHQEIEQKRRSTLVLSGFKEPIPRDELVKRVTDQQLGSPSAIYTKMRFSRVAFVLNSSAEDARAQLTDIRKKSTGLMHGAQQIHVGMDRGPEDRRRGWILRELRRHLCKDHSADDVSIDYGPGVVYLKRDVAFFIRDQQVHVGKLFAASTAMVKTAEGYTCKLCF